MYFRVKKAKYKSCLFFLSITHLASTFYGSKYFDFKRSYKIGKKCIVKKRKNEKRDTFELGNKELFGRPKIVPEVNGKLVTGNCSVSNRSLLPSLTVH